MKFVEYEGVLLFEEEGEVLKEIEKQTGVLCFDPNIDEGAPHFFVRDKHVTQLCVTNTIDSLPDCIKSLQYLQILHLNDNLLERIPDSIGDLQALKELNLENNELRNLPESIGNLKNLEILNVKGNKLESLPENIGNLEKLRYLDISNNNLQSLPESIQNLKALEIFKIDKNSSLSLSQNVISILQTFLKAQVLIDSKKIQEFIRINGVSIDMKAKIFVKSMYDGVLGSNFIFKHYSISFPNKKVFLDTVDNEDNFRSCVIAQIRIISQNYWDKNAYVNQYEYLKTKKDTSKEEIDALNQRYIEVHPEITGSYAFALWFYHFDYDNWFSFQSVFEKVDSYLGDYFYFDDRLEFRLFKGFKNAHVLCDPVTVLDLPVVVNYSDQTVTIFTGQLND